MKNQDLVTILERYNISLISKMRIEQKSENTIKSYENTIKLFIRFLRKHNNITLLNIMEKDIYDFFTSKTGKSKSLKSSSISVMLSHLKRLFKFIERNSEELYDFDKVFEDIKMKNKTSKPKGLIKEEQDKIISQLNKELMSCTSKTAFIVNRNSFLIKLMLFSGLRVSEALSITIGHLKQELNDYESLEFIGKGEKDRFSLIKHSIISQEVDFFTEMGYDSDTPIATTRNGTPLNRSNFYLIAKRLFARAGVNKKGLHILRHSFAKNLVEENKSVTVIQKLLGHASLQTTSVYTNPTKKMIIDNMTKGG